jgi:hypothetical protein
LEVGCAVDTTQDLRVYLSKCDHRKKNEVTNMQNKCPDPGSQQHF